MLEEIGGEKMIVINIENIYRKPETAKLDLLPEYISSATSMAGDGEDVILTGAGPVWLYLSIAHALHGKCRKLFYTSPVTGDVLIFDHSAR